MESKLNDRGGSPPPRIDQIINATRVLFVRYGYRRTAMDDIAREAGVAKATLYLHFAGKEDVFRAMVMRCRGITSERCDAAERMDAPLEERLVAFLDAVFGTALEWFGDASHLNELRVFVTSSDAPELADGPVLFHDRLSRFLDVAAANGELDLRRPGLSSEAVSKALMYGARGAMRDEAPTRDSFREALRIIVKLAMAAMTVR